jgi:hypothetical protein
MNDTRMWRRQPHRAEKVTRTPLTLDHCTYTYNCRKKNVNSTQIYWFGWAGFEMWSKLCVCILRLAPSSKRMFVQPSNLCSWASFDPSTVSVVSQDLCYHRVLPLPFLLILGNIAIITINTEPPQNFTAPWILMSFGGFCGIIFYRL